MKKETFDSEYDLEKFEIKLDDKMFKNITYTIYGILGTVIVIIAAFVWLITL